MNKPKLQFRWPISPQRLLAEPVKTESTLSERKEKLWAILAYIFFPISLIFGPRDSEFVMFHTRQSFGIFLGSVVVYLAVRTLGLFVLGAVLNVVLFAIWCVGIINALQYKKKPLPVIGNFSEKYRVF